MDFQKLVFNNPKGDRLAARLDLPIDGEVTACALFAHCFTCSKNLKAVGNITRALTHEGIAVLRFDFTGLGESEGDFADTNFSSNVADLLAAADFLRQNYSAPKILIGHSLGGAAVLQAAGELSSVSAIATIAAPADPGHVTRLFSGSIREIEAQGEAEITLAGRSFKVKKQFLDDLEATKMRDTIRSLRRALLVFHSPVDNTVGIENASRIFEAAKHPKSFVSLDQADHLLSNESDSRYVGTVTAAWAKKYLEPEGQLAQEKKVADKRVVVRTGKTGLRTEILSDGHRLIADEPAALGGTEAGPTPYDLLLAALGSCTGMTLRMYANRKEWPLDSVVIRLKHDKIYAKDCEECETSEGKLDEIEREIELRGPLSPEQKSRLMEIADRCPVHRTLHAEILVKSSLKE